MTNYNKFKEMNLEQLVDWLDKNCNTGDMPWDWWFQRNYCDKCEPVVNQDAFYTRDIERAFCEVNGYCRFFKDHEETLDPKEVLELWLLSESEETK